MADYVVVDVETTGLGKLDRIVEIAAVVLDGSTLGVLDEYDTLINPMRDVGPTAIHGVTASMVEAAPTFEDVAISLANILDGRILVAHNISFDKRFVHQEFNRAGAVFDAGYGICTLSLTREKLAAACARRGIQISQAHRALADARATGLLLASVLSDAGDATPISIEGLVGDWKTMTLRRDVFPDSLQLPVVRTPRSLRFPTSDGTLMAYLDVLDSYLDDLVLTDHERSSLQEFSQELGIDSALIPDLHWAYLQSVIHAAQRDGRISDFERDTMVRIATALNLPLDGIPAVSTAQVAPSSLEGLRVCFTGEPVLDGRALARSVLESIAANAGMQPVSGVTKKGCDLLVAADTSSMSGKARKAMDYGIPVMSVAEFLSAVGQ
jgi:DNA polymerase-3 subunit epsilon